MLFSSVWYCCVIMITSLQRAVLPQVPPVKRRHNCPFNRKLTWFDWLNWLKEQPLTYLSSWVFFLYKVTQMHVWCSDDCYVKLMCTEDTVIQAYQVRHRVGHITCVKSTCGQICHSNLCMLDIGYCKHFAQCLLTLVLCSYWWVISQWWAIIRIWWLLMWF